MFRIRCEEKGLHLRVECQNEAMPVHGDEGKLRQILINLMGNAVKFTKEGEVKLVVSRSRRKEAQISQQDPDPSLVTPAVTDRYLFEIIDTGNGISPEGIAQLFQPFQQGEEGMKQGGTGLGLAISKRQLDLMQSALKVESEVGTGSRFYFEVELPPAKDAVSSAATRDQRKVIGLKPGHSVRALVVDDVEQNRAVLSQLLRGIGCEVVTANSGEEALTAVQQNIPDIVFMDIRMPGMDGTEALRRIREQLVAQEPSIAKLKFVAISASVLRHEQDEFTRSGFELFIRKPFRLEEIWQCLEDLLQVEFVFEESSVAGGEGNEEKIDFAGIQAPAELLARMKDAAELYSTTEVREQLEELRGHNPDANGAIARLHELNEAGAIEEFLRALNEVRSM